MSGETIDLAVIIKTLLDAKGFEEAQAYLKGFKAAANDAKPAAQGLTDEQKKLTREFGGTRGALADMTRVLLQNIGVTGPAGEVAKAAGIGFNFLAGGASLVAAGAAGIVAAAALLLPMLIDWAKGTKDTDEATRDLKSSIVGMLPELEEYMRLAPKATEELKALYHAQRDQAHDEQRKKIADLTKTINVNQTEIARLRAGTAAYVETLAKGEVIVHAAVAAKAEDREKADELAVANSRLTGALNSLLGAEADGVLLGDQVRKMTDDLRTASEKRAKALQDEERAQRDLEKAGKSYTDVINERKQAEIGPEDDKRREGEKLGALTQEQIDLLVSLGQTEEQVEAERKKLTAERDQDERESAANKRALMAETTGQAAAGLLSFFGKSKAVAIAQAIADTYAGADKALAQGGFFGFAMAAAVIAAGLANVNQIRKADAGFDVPANDRLAEMYGEKWGRDWIRHTDVGMQRAMRGMGGGGGGDHYHTRIDRSVHLGIGDVSGVLGSRTQFRKWLEREMVKALRLQKITTLGRG